MRRLKIIIGLTACILIGIRTNAQNAAATSIPLMDLKSPNSPCFQLLDIAPASVTHPATPKEFGLSALSQLESGHGALPTNFAFELAPYWYFKTKRRERLQISECRYE